MFASITRNLVFKISNIGGETLDWQAKTDKSWIELSKTSGSNDGLIIISINSAVLSSGKHIGTIIIASNAGTESVIIEVNVPTPTPTPTPTGFRIVEVMLRADPFDYIGPCPVQITFSGIAVYHSRIKRCQ